MNIRKSVLLIFSMLIVIVMPLVCTAPTATPSTPKSGKGQIKVLESKLSQEKEKLEKFDSREKDLMAELSELEQAVAHKRETVREVKNSIRLGRREAERLKKEVSGLEQALKGSQNRISKRLVALYKYARSGYLRVLASSSDAEQFWHRVKYVGAIIAEDRKTLFNLAEQVPTLNLGNFALYSNFHITNLKGITIRTNKVLIEKLIRYFQIDTGHAEFHGTFIKTVNL